MVVKINTMEITVKELIERLKAEDQDKIVYFGGLEFFRLKDRGDLIQVEFNQTVSLDQNGNVQVQNH